MKHNSSDNAVLDTVSLAKLLDRANAAARAMAVGSFLLLLSTALLVAHFVSGRPITMRPAVLASAVSFMGVLILVAALLLTMGIVRLRRFKKRVAAPISVYEHATEYADFVVSRVRTLFIPSVVAAVLCFLLCLLPLTAVLTSAIKNANYAVLAYVIIFFLIALGAGVLAYAITRKTCTSGLALVTVADTDNADRYLKRRFQRKPIVGLILFWLIPILFYVIISYLMSDWLAYLVLPAAFMLLFVALVLINNPWSKWAHIRKHNKGVRRLRWGAVLVFSLLAVYVMSLGSWSIMSYVVVTTSEKTRNLPIEYDRDTGIYSITNTSDQELRVLQITDIHLGGSVVTSDKDLKALEAVYKLIHHARPDLIIITGDIVYPVPLQTFSYNNYVPMAQFVQFMNRLNIPWTMIYGNHDTEVFSTHTAKQLNQLFEGSSFAADSANALLFPHKQPNIYGRNNQIIYIKNADGSLNQTLYLLDSNDYQQDTTAINNYDAIHDDQVYWYRDSVTQLSAQNGATISSLMFFHIPTQEFRDVTQLYQAGSPDVEHLFGELREEASCPDKVSIIFDVIKELGSTKAVFIGHDHLNDIGLSYQGIQYVYGKSIDYLAYPGISKLTEQRGATLIKLFAQSKYEIEQIKLTDIA